MVYYNEIDPKAAAWLRELIREGHIAAGVVDERSIRDVTPNDLKHFTQCHFFAGIGAWSYALRLAAWPDDRPVWTGSCPCQPFSTAGKGGGFADERHLWPDWHHLINVCRPPVVFGEQVASADGLKWFDLVHTDLEAAGYAVGAADLCAAGVGAPHIRQRLWFVADAESRGESRGSRQLGPPFGAPLASGRYRSAGTLADSSSTRLEGRDAGTLGRQRTAAERGCGAGGLDDAEQHRGRCEAERTDHIGPQAERPADQHGGRGGALGGVGYPAGRGTPAGEQPRHLHGFVEAGPVVGGLADGHEDRRVAAALARIHDAERLAQPRGGVGGLDDPHREPAGNALCTGRDVHGGPGPDRRPDALHQHWNAADWIFCRDNVWRPVEPGTQPLAHGAPARVGRLRGYGNAIVVQIAATFVSSYLDVITCA